jgi:hypothetical protein
MANCPCSERLIVALHDVRGHCPCGKELVVTLLNECRLLGVLTILALGNVHAVFGILTVLAFGNIHAISSILAVLDVGIFVPLIFALQDMVIIASCKQQHENLIVAFSLFVLPLHLSVIVVAPCNKTIMIVELLTLCCGITINYYRWHLAPL